MLSHRQREAMNAAMLRYAADPDAHCTRPLEYALRSLARMERARFDDAAADARLATGAKLARVAGHLLFACGYFGEGLDRIADADTPSARSLRARLSAKMGWTLDALDAIHEALDKGDAAPALLREAAFIHAGARDNDHAYSFARRALLDDGQLADDHDLTLLVANVAPPAERTFALEALSKLPPAAQETSLHVALAYRRLGADADAVTHLERCAASTDSGLADEARALLALIAFEEGDDVATRRWAKAVRDFEGRGRIAECVLGALAPVLRCPTTG